MRPGRVIFNPMFNVNAPCQQWQIQRSHQVIYEQIHNSPHINRGWFKLFTHQANLALHCMLRYIPVSMRCCLSQNLENLQHSSENLKLSLFLRIFLQYKMSCLFNFGTYLVIITISIYLVFLIGVFCLFKVQYFNPFIRISSNNKQHHHSRHLASYLVYRSEGSTSVAGR
jgi:hypothetical protein